MKERGPNTLAVHAGEVPDPVTGASAPNLVMSSTFALDEPAGFSINAFEGERPYIYTRWGNPTVKMLEEKLAALEGAEDCVHSVPAWPRRWRCCWLSSRLATIW